METHKSGSRNNQVLNSPTTFSNLMRDYAVSEIIGVVLMVAIVVALSAAIFVVLTSMTATTQTMPKFPTFSQQREDGKLLVLYTGGQQEVKWSDLLINPDTVEIYDEDYDGFLDGGEYLLNCTGKEVKISYIPANVLIGTWDFT